MFAYILGVIAGAASTTQASVNTRIKKDLMSTYTTSILNFVVASAVIAVIVLLTEGNLSIPFETIAREPLWIWLGGSCGTVIVILNVVCLPHLGSARNVMIVCFGQIMTSLLMDHFGIFGSPVTRMSMSRVLGAVLVIAGVALVNGIRMPGKSAARFAETGEKPGSVNNEGAAVYALLALINGFACASQVAINGSLGTAAGSAFKATLVSMMVGLITTVIAALAVLIIRGRDGLLDGDCEGQRIRFKWWMLLGGSLGIVIVGGNAVIASSLGTGLVTVMNLIGMMGSGLIIDATGFLGIEKKPVTIAKAAGMLLMIAGTAVISLL